VPHDVAHHSEEAVPLPPSPGWASEYIHIGEYHEAVEVLKHPDLEVIQGNRPMAEGTMVTLRGELHRALRRRLNPLFRRELLEVYENAILGPTLENRLARLVEGTHGESVDVVPFIGIANIMVTAAVVGIDDIDDDESAGWLARYAEAWGESINSQWTVDVEQQRKIVERGLSLRDDFISRFYESSVARRRGNPTEREDVLSLLLRDEEPWPEERLINEVVLFINGSSQTTAKATAAAVVDLGRWFAQDPDRRKLADDVQFLKRAAHETNRLHPSQPAILREALADGTFTSSGRGYKTGDRFFVDCNRANRDVAIYGSDADLFDPFRTPADSKASPYGVTFGGGRHVCIGRAMAVGQARSTGEGDSSVGAMTRIVGALYRAGLELDPKKEPEIDTTNTRGSYRRVWMVADVEPARGASKSR
jgi:cytochrome P450